MKDSVWTKANEMKGLNEIALKGEIVIFGSTYMSEFPFYELINRCKLENAVYNRSIAGMTVHEAKELLRDCVISIRPSKVFLCLGEEDRGNPDAVCEYTDIVEQLCAALPEASIYLICLSETCEDDRRFNANIRSLCERKKNVSTIVFTCAATSPMAQYKARFRQMSCFFREQPMSLADAFQIADL